MYGTENLDDEGKANHMCTMSDWHELLTSWSREWLSTDRYITKFGDATRDSGWLGYPPTKSEIIKETEHRLGVVLPPSYKNFLGVTNGWQCTTDVVDSIWPIEGINWLHINQKDLLDDFDPSSYNSRWSSSIYDNDKSYSAYGAQQSPIHFRFDHLRNALQITPFADDWGGYVLIPDVVGPDGEWEAWYFSPELLGAHRYRSFWDLMIAEHQRFLSGPISY